ncbi:MAG: hypothetical protein ABI273_21820, partial [Lacunisphaera sp.]
LLGSGMILLPAHAPEFFTADELSQLSRSALWLSFMGWLNGALGGFYLAKNAVVPRILGLLEWRPASTGGLITAQILRPAIDIYGKIESGENLREERLA